MDGNGTDSDTLVPKSLCVGRSDVGLGCTCFVVSAAARLRGGGLGLAMFQFLGFLISSACCYCPWSR